MYFNRQNVIPEEEGIPAKAVSNFITELQQKKINMHGFMLIRNGKTLVEAYYEPYRENSLHRMYSVAKSFTALAIGALIEDGKIKLDDHICDYFKDKLPKDGVHEYIKAMTIRDMLTMTTAHSKTTYKGYGEDWVESFFHVAPCHYPGTIFSYDTSSPHVLTALVERLTGMDMLDYLRSKAFEEIGFSKEAYFLKDPQGVSQGGSGLLCTMRDLALVANLCLHYGKHEGKQLISMEYIKDATRKHVSTALQQTLDEQCGYGYFFWRNRYQGFCMYGMGGQLAICFPEYDFILITMADTQGNPCGLQLIYDAFYNHIFPYVQTPVRIIRESKDDMECKEYKEHEELVDLLGNLKIPTLQGNYVSSYTNLVSDKKYMLNENPMEIHWFTLDLLNHILTYENENGEHSLYFDFGNYVERDYEEYGGRCISCAVWESDNTFLIQTYILGETLGRLQFQFAFRENVVTLRMRKIGERIVEKYEGVANGTLNCQR